MSELDAYIQSLPTEVAVGQRHTTYKEWALQALALAGSVHLLAYHNLARCDSILFILEEDIEERAIKLWQRE